MTSSRHGDGVLRDEVRGLLAMHSPMLSEDRVRMRPDSLLQSRTLHTNRMILHTSILRSVARAPVQRLHSVLLTLPSARHFQTARLQ